MPPKYTPVLNHLPLIYQGKTRDTYPTKSPDELLIVATNRLDLSQGKAWATSKGNTWIESPPVHATIPHGMVFLFIGCPDTYGKIRRVGIF